MSKWNLVIKGVGKGCDSHCEYKTCKNVVLFYHVTQLEFFLSVRRQTILLFVYIFHFDCHYLQSKQLFKVCCFSYCIPGRCYWFVTNRIDYRVFRRHGLNLLNVSVGKVQDGHHRHETVAYSNILYLKMHPLSGNYRTHIGCAYYSRMHKLS